MKPVLHQGEITIIGIDTSLAVYTPPRSKNRGLGKRRPKKQGISGNCLHSHHGQCYNALCTCKCHPKMGVEWD